MTILNNSSPNRITVQIPTASGDAIEAWVYLPEGSGPHPAVVMAHGIGAIKAGGLAPFAERFREEGFAAIGIDYRNFGGSGGQPREVLSVPRQRADYSTEMAGQLNSPTSTRVRSLPGERRSPACISSNSLSLIIDLPQRSPRPRSPTALPQR